MESSTGVKYLYSHTFSLAPSTENHITSLLAERWLDTLAGAAAQCWENQAC